MRIFLVVFLTMASLFANNIDFEHIFKKHGFDGTIIISSLDAKKEYIYNKKRSLKEFSPASTFKIVSSLIALQEGVIKNQNQTIKWDGKDKGFAPWNQDHTMKSAFKVSCVWCYQDLAKKIGLESFKKHLKSLKYGNAKVGDNPTKFWLDGDLKISAAQQIKLLKKIYLNEVPIDKKYIVMLKDMMQEYKTDKYTIYAKTGWSLKSKIGWYVGFMKTQNDVWFFAMNIDMSKIKDAQYRKTITMEALKKVTPESFK